MTENTDIKRSKKIMSLITEQNIAQNSRFAFVIHNYFIWFLWLVSVFAGAVALSVVFFVVKNGWFEFYEISHYYRITYSLAHLPLIWLTVFTGLVVLAYINFRKTVVGYRYPFWQVVLSSLVFSLLGATLFTALGVGKYLDREMGERLPIYVSQMRLEENLWQMPSEGRLLGVAKKTDDGFEFLDIDQTDWKLAMNELTERENNILNSGQYVRLVGVAKNDTFYVCVVMPGKVTTKHKVIEMAPYLKNARIKLTEATSSNTKQSIGCLETPVRVHLMPRPLQY